MNFNAPVGTSTLRSLRLPASLIAQSAGVTRFCLCEYSVMLRDIDEASLHIAFRFKACAVLVLVRLLPKVPSFGPREQFLPGA